MTYEQIVLESAQKITEHYFEKGMRISINDFHHAESVLEQSFIKYLQSEIERLEKYISFSRNNYEQQDPDGLYNVGIKDGISDQITHISNQIKELEGHD